MRLPHPQLALVAVAMSAAALATVPRAAADGQSASTRGCALKQSTRVEAATTACGACHREGHRSHPVEFDYGSVQGSHPLLRPLAEVVKRGVFLPDGKLQCVTCHSPRSPWRYQLALPPGSTPTPAVDPADPSTYEPGPARDQLVQEIRAGKPGAAVSAKPLCLACHAFD